VKVKFDDFEQITRQMQTARPVSEAYELLAYARHLLQTKVRLSRPVRLIGITVHQLEDAAAIVVQPALFPEVGLPTIR
jgi:DNA polymerase-4